MVNTGRDKVCECVRKSSIHKVKNRSSEMNSSFFLAFENFQSAVNPPVISPTPCLKIRNMFDPDV